MARYDYEIVDFDPLLAIAFRRIGDRAGDGLRPALRPTAIPSA